MVLIKLCRQFAEGYQSVNAKNLMKNVSERPRLEHNKNILNMGRKQDINVRFTVPLFTKAANER